MDLFASQISAINIYVSRPHIFNLCKKLPETCRKTYFETKVSFSYCLFLNNFSWNSCFMLPKEKTSSKNFPFATHAFSHILTNTYKISQPHTASYAHAYFRYLQSHFIVQFYTSRQGIFGMKISIIVLNCFKNSCLLATVY